MRRVDFVGRSFHRHVFWTSPVLVVQICSPYLSVEYCWGRVRLEEVVRSPFKSFAAIIQSACKHWFAVGHVRYIWSVILNLQFDDEYDLRLLF